jgi:hypothetical protein
VSQDDNLKRRTFHPLLIIAITVSCLAALIPFLACYLSSGITSNTPSRVPQPSQKPEQILAIETAGFYGANLIVRTTGGETLAYRVGAVEPHWQPHDEEYYAQDSPCTGRVRRRMESVAGLITDCRQVSLIGEWLPGPDASYAIDSDGNLWELITQRPPYALLVPVYALIGMVLLIEALVLVAVKYFLDKRKTPHKRSNRIVTR